MIYRNEFPDVCVETTVQLHELEWKVSIPERKGFCQTDEIDYGNKAKHWPRHFALQGSTKHLF